MRHVISGTMEDDLFIGQVICFPHIIERKKHVNVFRLGTISIIINSQKYQKVDHFLY